MSVDANLVHRFAEVGEVTLHYVTAGEGPPMVLLHRWPQTWWEWRRVIPVLAQRYTVVAPDLRGLDVVIPGCGGDFSQGKRRWHHQFHITPDLPEALTAGREDVYLSWFYRTFAYRPDAISTTPTSPSTCAPTASPARCGPASPTTAPSPRMPPTIRRRSPGSSCRCRCSPSAAR